MTENAPFVFCHPLDLPRLSAFYTSTMHWGSKQETSVIKFDFDRDKIRLAVGQTVWWLTYL
jgi:hypothetical protein